MKSNILISWGVLAAMALAHAQAQTTTPQTTTPLPPPSQPPIYPAATPPTSTAPVYVYDQKPMTPSGRSYLIAPEQAQSIINRFKEAYQKMGAPRVLIYVNRDLIDANSGMKLSAHKQVIETSRPRPDKDMPAPAPGVANQPAASASADSARGLERAVSTNIYRIQDRKETPLPDRQTVRDMERLFGRPLRMAGVRLADQGIASQLIGSKALENFAVQPEGEQAIKDREALRQIADVVLEILVSSKEVPVAEVSGDQAYSAPDIQATAIRLSDAQILGQATAADLIGLGPSAGVAARTFGMREIAEATSLSLMEDMLVH